MKIYELVEIKKKLDERIKGLNVSLAISEEIDKPISITGSQAAELLELLENYRKLLDRYMEREVPA